MLRLGIDVGGTNTDAVVMEGAEIRAGVKRAHRGRDGRRGRGRWRRPSTAGVAREARSAVMIGTTHFTNAVVERRHSRCRRGPHLPARRAMPAADGGLARRHPRGGRRSRLLDGARRQRIRRARDRRARRGPSWTASPPKSPRRASNGGRHIGVLAGQPDAMERAAEMARPQPRPARGRFLSEIGRLGILERENAAIMNASLLGLSHRTSTPSAARCRGRAILPAITSPRTTAR
jgi:hypothetical protein